jgi:hypothetical protein
MKKWIKLDFIDNMAHNISVVLQHKSIDCNYYSILLNPGPDLPDFVSKNLMNIHLMNL